MLITFYASKLNLVTKMYQLTKLQGLNHTGSQIFVLPEDHIKFKYGTPL